MTTKDTSTKENQFYARQDGLTLPNGRGQRCQRLTLTDLGGTNGRGQAVRE